MDWVSKKDMVSFAGFDNTDVEGKEAVIGTAGLTDKVTHALGDVNSTVVNGGQLAAK